MINTTTVTTTTALGLVDCKFCMISPLIPGNGVCVCVCVCMRARACMYMCVCMRAYLHVCVDVFVCMQMYYLLHSAGNGEIICIIYVITL